MSEEVLVIPGAVSGDIPADPFAPLAVCALMYSAHRLGLAKGSLAKSLLRRRASGNVPRGSSVLAMYVSWPNTVISVPLQAHEVPPLLFLISDCRRPERR